MEDNTSPLDPQLVPPSKEIYIHKEDRQRVLLNKLPGYIADMSRGAQWPGCRMVTFGYGWVKGLEQDVEEMLYTAIKNRGDKHTLLVPAELVNAFFETFANYYVAGWTADHSGITIMYSAILDEEDTGDLQEISNEIRKAMNAKRAARKAAADAAEAKAKAETDELLALGKKAKDHNLLEKLKEQEQTIKELRSELKTAKRG